MALVGCGRRVLGYFNALAKNKDAVRVAYICDVMKSRREKAAEQLSPKIGYMPSLEND